MADNIENLGLDIPDGFACGPSLVAVLHLALLLQALVRGVELVPAVVVGVQDILDVRCTAMEVHVVAADLLDQPGRGPHADAPWNRWNVCCKVGGGLEITYTPQRGLEVTKTPAC